MIYTGEYTREISFPLGGIGSGSIGLDGTGRLVDWEIYNRPSKGSFNGFTHIAVKATNQQGTVTRVLQGDMEKNYNGTFRKSWGVDPYGNGMPNRQMSGFPHFSSHRFCGEFPVARVEFTDPGFPAEVHLHAFNPLIPLDSKNSSIPGAFFEVELENTAPIQTDYQVAFSLQNPYLMGENTAFAQDGYRALTVKNSAAECSAVEYGDLTVATDCPDSLCQPYWYRGKWMDPIVTFWNEFSGPEDLKPRQYGTPWDMRSRDCGTLAAKVSLAPGEKKKVRFVLTWNVPNVENDWDPMPENENNTWKNYYATIFEDSRHTAAYCLEHWEMLQEKTLAFQKSLFSSTVDPVILEAASANLSVLKTATVLRLEDGSFWGWEGITEDAGSCQGTCQHVWNYAYGLCFLFPDLERSIRDAEFSHGMFDSGKTAFRLRIPYDREPMDFHACVDGQMGLVLKCYREWKISGRDDWLKGHWQDIQKALEYAWSDENPDEWDRNKDGVLEGRQHHTLDMELFGPSSWLQGMYQAALKAGAEMAAYLGEDAKAAEYLELYEKGRGYTSQQLFNGKWFFQKVNLEDKAILDHFGAAEQYWNEEAGQIKYQIGQGSEIDQMLGQWHAELLGLGDVFEPEQVQTALDTMLEQNFKPSMREFANPWRLFAVNDEAGTVMCEYPAGAVKPAIPVPYCEECMTGFEYAFAGLLAANHRVEEALKVIKAVRDRYDGKKRNPWNEIECGNNYARSMASFALLPIFAGFTYDIPRGYVGFAPLDCQEDFSCFWCLEPGWGCFRRTGNTHTLEIQEGNLTLSAFGLPVKGITSVHIDGKPVDVTFANGRLSFEKQTITKTLTIQTEE